VIISPNHKYVFVAVPKTGTHAVRQALRPHMGAGDMEQVGLFVKRQFPIPDLAKVGHGHISLEQLRKFMDPAKFAEYFKFAFVRNPFDRFISYCSFITRERGGFKTDPQKVMRRVLANPPSEHVLFWPQNTFLVDGEGKLLTDYVGRVETMQQSFEFIASKIGVPAVQLEKVNATERSAYRDYYDQELIDGVAKLYADDLKLFEYDF
jgi:hypothetical protein